MSDADERLGHSLDEGPEPATFKDVELPPARWAAVRSRFPLEDTRLRISEGLAASKGGGFELSATRHGFIVSWMKGQQLLVAEVALTGWEEGTQVHLTVPKDSGATEEDLQTLRRRLFGAVG